WLLQRDELPPQRTHRKIYAQPLSTTSRPGSNREHQRAATQYIPFTRTHTRYARPHAFHTHNFSLRSDNRTLLPCTLRQSSHKLWCANLPLGGRINRSAHLWRKLRFKLPRLVTAQPVHLQAQPLPRLPPLLAPRYPFRMITHDSQRARLPILKLETCLLLQTLHQIRKQRKASQQKISQRPWTRQRAERCQQTSRSSRCLTSNLASLHHRHTHMRLAQIISDGAPYHATANNDDIRCSFHSKFLYSAAILKYPHIPRSDKGWWMGLGGGLVLVAVGGIPPFF